MACVPLRAFCHGGSERFGCCVMVALRGVGLLGADIRPGLLQVGRGDDASAAQLAQQAATPALLVIGEVVSLHHKLCWFGQQPQQFVGTHRALWHPLQTGSAEDPHASTPAATVLVPANAAETVETV